MDVAGVACGECEKDRKALGRLLAAVLAVTDAGIVVFDEYGRFVMANPSFRALFGWRPTAQQTETFSSLFPDAKLPSSAIRLPRSVSAGRYQTRIRGGNGALIDVEVHARWITHEEEDSYWVAALMPISAGTAPATTLETAAPTPPVENDTDSFGKAVRERIRQGIAGPYVMAGHLGMSKLDAIRRAAGSQWPQVAGHIFAETEAILARNLSEADAFAHDGDGGFTICFGDALLGDAEQRTMAIERDIRQHLTGQFGVAAAPEPKSHVDQIALRNGETEVPDIGTLIASRLAEKRALIERVSNMTLAQVIDSATLETQDVVRQSGRLTPLQVVCLDRISSRAVQKIAAASIHAADITDQVDHLVLGLTATRIYECLSTTVPATFIVPVSFATFINRRLTDRYLNMCRNLSPGVVQHLMFELVGVPDDVAGMRIEDIVASLRPFSRQQCLRLSGLEKNPARPWERHFKHFTVLYENIGTYKRDIDALRSMSNSLHQRRCRIGIQCVPDQSTARTLTEAGVDFVSGAGLMPWFGDGDDAARNV